MVIPAGPFSTGVSVALLKPLLQDSAAAPQRALEQAELWFETTLRSIGEAVIATDAEGRIQFMNPVAEQLTGWSSVEALSRLHEAQLLTYLKLSRLRVGLLMNFNVPLFKDGVRRLVL